MQLRIKRTLTVALALIIALGAPVASTVSAAAAEPVKPVITMNPADRSVTVGGTTTFSVTAAGEGVLGYVWYERDSSGIYQPIEDFSAGGMYSGSRTQRLTLSNVPASCNGRRYLCRVSNAAGYTDSASAALTVTATGAPIITSQPVDSRVYEGGGTTFSVIAAGDPTPTYQWMYLDVLSESGWLNVTDGGVYSGANTPTLSLVNVPISFNERRYMCVVSGGDVNVDSSIARLSIVPSGSPIIVSQPVSRSVTEGKNTVFSITATGSPALSYQWMYRDLKHDAEWYNITNGGFYSGATTSVLTITAADIDLDGFRYCCYLKNSVGFLQSAEVTLTVVSSEIVAPVISGPESLILEEGYATTSTEVFTVTGGNATTVKVTSGDAKITWNDMTRKLNIAEGLAIGSYPVTLTVSTGASQNTLFTFTLTVIGKDVSDMSNFAAVNTYERGQFSDVDESAWYGFDKQKTIVTAYEYGLMIGNINMTFNPAGSVTIAEAITIAARVHSIYTTGRDEFVQGTPWFQVYVDYAVENHVIVDDDFVDYNRVATRAEMAYIFAAALPEKELAVLNTVVSLPDVQDDTIYSHFIFMLYSAGILTGSDEYGAFKPFDNITRAEAAAIISRVILPENRVSGRTYSWTPPGESGAQDDPQSGESQSDEFPGDPGSETREPGGYDPGEQGPLG